MQKKHQIAAAISVAVLAVAYVGASWHLGKKAEESYQAQMDKAEALLGAGTLAERSYERGIFTSTGRVVVTITLPPPRPRLGDQDEEDDGDEAAAPPSEAAAAAAPRSVRITVENRVRHGPLAAWRVAAAAVQTRFTAMEGIDEPLRQAFAKARPPVITTVYGLGGGRSGTLTLPAGEAQDVANPQNVVRWQQAEMGYRSNAEGTQIQGDMRWPLLTLSAVANRPQASSMQFTLQGLSGVYDMDLRGGQWMMAPGVMQGQIDKLALAVGTGGKEAQPIWEMTDTTFDSATTSEGPLLHNVQRMAGKGRVGNQALDALKLEVALRRIDATQLALAQKLMVHDLTHPQAQGRYEGVATPEQIAQMAQALLDAQPEYRVTLGATLQGQAGELGYGVVIGQPALGAQKQLPIQAQILQRMSADATLRLPKAWLPVLAQALGQPQASPEALATMAARWVGQGWLKDDGTAYTLAASYGQNGLQLNGKPLMGRR